MINKVFNWSFGAFFKTLGRILAYVLVGFLLAIVCSKLGFNFGYIKVNAQTLTNWAEGLPTLNRVQMYECQTSNKCYDKEVNIQGLVTVNGNRDIAISQSLTLDSGGVSIQTNVNELKEGYLYLTNYYVCANYSLNNVDALIYNSNYGTPGVANTIYNSTSIATLSNIPGSGEQEFTSCKLYSGLYVPNVANNWATLRLKKSTSQSGTYISLIAVENRELGIYTDTIKTIVENANGNVQQAVNEVKEETKKTNDALTSSSDDDEEESCGIICKLKSIVKFLKPTSLSNLIIPNEDQMHDLMDTMQTQVVSKLGILSFPITLYTQIIDLVQNVSDTNWCIDWSDVTVPNFEDSVIIESGQFCFSTILQNEKVSTFRNSCLVIIGGLILLAFAQFLKNCYNRVLDLPDRDDYTYVTTEDVYSVNSRGEAELKQVRNRSTYKEKR